MIDLSQVTLCAIDTEPVLAVRAMNICLEQCEFGDAVLITNKLINAPFRVAHVDIQTSIPGWYSFFCVKQLANYISTPFVLLVQYDGYIVHPECWDIEFLKYDYIGSVWPIEIDVRGGGGDSTILAEYDYSQDNISDETTDKRRVIPFVGNGGFSLRSRKLLELTAELPAPGDALEDYYICMENRMKLENSGVIFAPAQVARKFSYESERPHCNTFGFHGLFNLRNHVSEAEIIRMIPCIGTYAVGGGAFNRMIAFYESRGGEAVLAALQERLSEVETSVRTVPDLIEYCWSPRPLLG